MTKQNEMTQVSTKKIPCSMRKDGSARLRGAEHLIPCLDGKTPAFVGIKTGKEYDRGYICYVGVDVSADDLLSKLKLEEFKGKEARPILEEYLRQLKQLKIGNVVTVSWAQPSMKLELQKLAERPVLKDCNPKLP